MVKRLLGLAYLWSGSLNSIEIPVWGSWLLYAVLVDMMDAVAEQLKQAVRNDIGGNGVSRVV